MAQPHIHSGEVKPLPPLGAALHAVRTHALLKASQLELVHLVLAQGQKFPEHAAPGEITLFGIEGTLRFTFAGEIRELTPGSLLHLNAGIPHAVEALTDASALLTICLQRPPTSQSHETHTPSN